MFNAMEIDLIKAQHYRDQAVQMRDLAAREDSPEAKQALIHLAEMYDRLYQNRLGAADSISDRDAIERSVADASPKEKD
jgi:hypothetical protein